jgi:hypothetical protein
MVHIRVDAEAGCRRAATPLRAAAIQIVGDDVGQTFDGAPTVSSSSGRTSGCSNIVR